MFLYALIVGIFPVIANTLAGLRMEDEHVFHETHELVLGWLHDGTLDGLRIVAVEKGSVAEAAGL